LRDGARMLARWAAVSDLAGTCWRWPTLQFRTSQAQLFERANISNKYQQAVSLGVAVGAHCGPCLRRRICGGPRCTVDEEHVGTSSDQMRPELSADILPKHYPVVAWICGPCPGWHRLAVADRCQRCRRGRPRRGRLEARAGSSPKKAIDYLSWVHQCTRPWALEL